MLPAIEIKNLSVNFKVRTFQSNTFKEWVMNSIKRRNDVQVISALKNIDLSVYPGESIAFIGHNGSGKSTLLKVIAGVIDVATPVTVRGRIGPMIELGTGFDLELNGYENIKLACTLMGISKDEIARKLPAIVEFSELQDFMEVPFKNYSSGMQARLGFACTTAIEPEVLLVDEVMAVGDSNFSRKCLQRIQQLQNKGCTIVMVSHDENTIRKFCDRALVLEDGELKYDGRVSRAFEIYNEIMDNRYLGVGDGTLETQKELRKQRMLRNDSDPEAERQRPNVDVSMASVQNGEPAFEVDLAQSFSLHFSVTIDDTEKLIGNIVCGIAFLKGDTRIGGFNSSLAGLAISKESLQNKFSVTFDFKDGLKNLMAGDYDIAFAIHDRDLERTVYIDRIKQISTLNREKGHNIDGDLIDLGITDIEVRIDNIK